MKLRNPLAFRPLPVTILCILVYLALSIPLLIVQHVVPQPSAKDGGNLTEAWHDLQTLTNGFHPYNSRQNDRVREWLLRRLHRYTREANSTSPNRDSRGLTAIISDTKSNVSYSENGTTYKPGLSVYFEGTNIIVYIRGSQDDKRDWWLTGEKPSGKGGVLVNAHYDSVSTGFGATDDGMGVVTILQLVKHFTQHQPRRGIVALLNNGEEDFLNGAWAFSQHPLSSFTRTFLNLEGAGAGGRATLFRSTDLEVTQFYGSSRLPFGNVLSADAFKRGFIRSETDYSFFYPMLGMRGLDVAFFEPRSRYHTDEDDMKHASEASLNHMMSAAFATIGGLSSDSSSLFDLPKQSEGYASRNQGSDAVWFDLFGTTFTLFKLQALFGISVAVLVVGPLTLFGIFFILHKYDRLYIFSYSRQSRWSENSEPVRIKGLYGFSRWPISFILASAAVVGLAFLIDATNPLILYSSPYAIWSMMLSAWFAVAYLCAGFANYLRPTALQRTYVLLWMFLGAWIVLVLATIIQQQQEVAGTYLFVFNFIGIYLATTVSLLEHFRLPRKSDYADEQAGPQRGQASAEGESAPPLRPSSAEGEDQDQENAVDESQDADERTSLLRGVGRTTFKRYSSPHQRGEEAAAAPITTTEDTQKTTKAYGSEQAWSSSLPSSLWFLEFLLVSVLPIILFGQAALLMTSATFQTLADGSPPLALYGVFAFLTILLLAPVGPFLHRFTYEVPSLLFLIFVGTLLYNMFAFPFSPANKLKVYFIQRIDLESGLNNVSLVTVGQSSYMSDIVSSLPSANGQRAFCNSSTVRQDLKECVWHGLDPKVVDSQIPYNDWLSFNVSRFTRNSSTVLLNLPVRAHSLTKAPSDDNKSRPQARFSIFGHNTRACKIIFDQPIRDFYVHGSAPADPRFPRVSDERGSTELRLWSREWDRTWVVDVWWDKSNAKEDPAIRDQSHSQENLASSRQGTSKGSAAPLFEGRVVCLWSDANQIGTIPALDEVKHYAPAWVTVTKAADGLVEGSKAFSA